MSKFASAVALSVALLCLNARAAISIIPPNSVVPDTAMVIHIDAARFNPDLLKAALKAIGADASIEEPLAKAKTRYDNLVAAGITSMTAVVFEERGGRPPVIMYFRTKSDADPQAVKKAIEGLSDGDRQAIVIEPQGHYMTVRDKGVAFAAAGDPARTQLFAEALASGGDAGMQIAFIPTDNMKKAMLAGGAPLKGVNDTGAALAKAKFTTFAVKLGETPNVTITASTDSEDTAKQLSDAVNSMLDELKQKASAPDAGRMAAVVPLIDGLRPTSSGGQVSVNVKTPVLAQIGEFVGPFFLFRAEAVAPQPAPPAQVQPVPVQPAK
jgi:hypothetical protein